MSPEEQVREAKRVELKLKRREHAAAVQNELNSLSAPGKRAATFLKGMTKEERQAVLSVLDKVDNLGVQP